MSGPQWRKGRLLVASPTLQDPNFHRTVVLVLEHSDDGALGVVLNRPTDLLSADALPPDLASSVGTDDVIFEGGPVEPQNVILLADFLDAPGTSELAVGSIGVVDPDDLDALSARVHAVRAYGGYAGWAAGQLEAEILEEAWIDADCVTADVFGDDAETLWARVLDRKGGNFRLVARMPVDPSLN